MKTGIIFTLNNKENEIDKNCFDAFIEGCKNIKICLVNNGSTDNTGKLLYEIQNRFPNNISVLSIKINKSEESALKAGFRYLLSKNDLEQISFSNQLDMSVFNLLPMF